MLDIYIGQCLSGPPSERLPPAFNEKKYREEHPKNMWIVRDLGTRSHKWDVSIKALHQENKEHCRREVGKTIKPVGTDNTN